MKHTFEGIDQLDERATDTSPNILFVFADDWGRYASAYAELEGEGSLNELIETPHFDRIARQGALFRNAFVPAPTCTPCRSSVLSGRYFWQTGLGSILQGAVWDRRVPSFPFLLRDAGYHIGFTYKVWSPGTPKDDPFGGAENRYQDEGARFCAFSQNVTKIAAETGDVEAAEGVLLDEARRNFNSFLEARPGKAPWCYWWGPTNTHRKWERGSGKALWGIDPESLKGRLPAFLPDVPVVREDVADYLGECMAVDAGLGALLEMIGSRGELDNTLIVVSGDHGIPGFPRAKCNLYDMGSEVALAVRLPRAIPAGRVIDDMVNIMDLAPTFLEAGGVRTPESMAGRSLMPVLSSEKDGQVDPRRTWVVTGRERHVAAARDWKLPYPQRAIRTHRYLYIRNFEPERWPMGDPKGLDDLTAGTPAFEELEHHTDVAYAEMDASPTKAWMIHHRAEEGLQAIYNIGFGKRPAEELYDLVNDPSYMHNLAGDLSLQAVREALAAKLMAELDAQNDPRVTEADCRFERAPFTDWPCLESDEKKRLAMVTWESHFDDGFACLSDDDC